MKRKYQEGEVVLINGVEYKFVTLKGRSKLVSKEGDLINPFKPNQNASVHFNDDDYPCAGGGVPVHRYVAVAWVDGYFDGAEVNHIDMDRTNYSADNLEWVTHKDNVAHSVKLSNHYSDSKKGSKNGRSVLTDDDVAYIRELYGKGYKTMEIVKIFYPDYNYDQRRRIWGRFDLINKGKSWNK